MDLLFCLLPTCFVILPPAVVFSGAVDEESFNHDFKANLPTVHLYGEKGVEDQMASIRAVISDETKHWETRTKAVRSCADVLDVVLMFVTVACVGLKFKASQQWRSLEYRMDGFNTD